MLNQALRLLALQRPYPEAFLGRVAEATATPLSDGHIQVVVWMRDGSHFVEVLPPEALAA